MTIPTNVAVYSNFRKDNATGTSHNLLKAILSFENGRLTQTARLFKHSSAATATVSRQQIFQTIGSRWNGQLAQVVFYLVPLIIFMCIMHLSVVFDIYVKTSHRYWYTKIQQVISKVYTFLTL